jgi:hypothetical protein
MKGQAYFELLEESEQRRYKNSCIDQKFFSMNMETEFNSFALFLRASFVWCNRRYWLAVKEKYFRLGVA